MGKQKTIKRSQLYVDFEVLVRRVDENKFRNCWKYVNREGVDMSDGWYHNSKEEAIIDALENRYIVVSEFTDNKYKIVPK
jgi:hypothetical protein